MTSSSPAPRTARYRPGLAWFAGVGSLWVFVLVFLGAYTTSTNSGMAFPDWPLSNGSINPPGWLTELDKFAEHSHRLSASLMGLITIAIALWIHRTESRTWLRRLGLFAVALVIFQGVVGGLRVLLDARHVNMVNTSVGRLFAMLHACLAQLFVCNLIAIACACSRPWIERSLPVSDGVRRLGVICCGLLFTQLAIAAVLILPVLYGALGTCAFVLRTVYAEMVVRSFDGRLQSDAEAQQRSLFFSGRLLLDRSNMTFSLSKFQFYGWTVVSVAAYVFYATARVLVQGQWDWAASDIGPSPPLSSLGPEAFWLSG